MLKFPQQKQTFLIEGPAGRLECLASSSEAAKNITCIICHPHPTGGGTMHNKVAYTLASTVNELGVKAVRFNFRGVEGSEGEFDEGVGELQDLLAVYQWVKSVCPDDDIWLAGFSFGSYISIKATESIAEIKQLISIAPPAGHPYFKELPAVTCPWVVVEGEEDEIALPENVYNWIASLDPQPKLIKIPEAGHFFHKKLVVLKQQLLLHLAA